MKAGWMSFIFIRFEPNHANFLFSRVIIWIHILMRTQIKAYLYMMLLRLFGIKDSSLIRLDEEFKAANASKVKKKQSTSENKLAAAVDPHKLLLVKRLQ